MENVTEMSDRSAEYHAIAGRWKSDLEFFKIESSFLSRLKQDYYFTRLSAYRHTEELQEAGQKLLKLQDDILWAEAHVDAQLHQLAQVAENKEEENSKKLALTNAKVGHLMINLTHEYQKVKKELFTAVDTIFRELEFQAS
ncbi:hypothetical protein SAMN05421821_12713 [Mucilaginibacter lappiensis]|nr:hypothetical protein SAMN05421821_12713 [Mucilaginibacter lappiensis]